MMVCLSSNSQINEKRKLNHCFYYITISEQYKQNICLLWSVVVNCLLWLVVVNCLDLNLKIRIKIKLNHYFLLYMEQYKQIICLEQFDCENEEGILRHVVGNKSKDAFTYNLNDDGKLHSRYLEEFGCYEPAIIFNSAGTICLYWLFDGEIKDCLHPFIINVSEKTNEIRAIGYYSSKRIQQLEPITLIYSDNNVCEFAAYNARTDDNDYENTTILNNLGIPSYITYNVPPSHKILDMSQFVTITSGIICPLWSDEFVSK